jgi:hypothetical protein
MGINNDVNDTINAMEEKHAFIVPNISAINICGENLILKECVSYIVV